MAGAPRSAGVESGGTVTKKGDGTFTLDGVQNYTTLNTNAGTTNIGSALGTGSSILNANARTNIGVGQTLDALNIGEGAVVVIGETSPMLAALGPVAVPEPATFGLLLAALGLQFGMRRNCRRND